MKASESTIQSLSNPFYRMVERLLSANELVLFGRINNIDPGQSEAVLNLLEAYYNREALGYPFVAPIFDRMSALWSSKILFHAAQLLMYREHEAESIQQLIPAYAKPKTAAVILSADITLRFIPNILKQLEVISIEDSLIPVLKTLLQEWHYSGLLSDVELSSPSFDEEFENKCLMQKYTDRVIEQKKLKIAKMNPVFPWVKRSLGNHAEFYWKEFTMLE